MSRLAKNPIPIPERTEVALSGTKVTVSGGKGVLERVFSPSISVRVLGRTLVLAPERGDSATKKLWGTTAAHLRNMMRGVNQPFVKKLLIEGIGFKAELRGKELVLSLGFSHPVAVRTPDRIAVSVEKNVITVSGADIEAVGEFAARVRALKRAEPYKGKGIRYEGEVVRRKQGKKAV